MFSSPGSLAFSIAGFGVHWYGILIGGGVLLAMAYSTHEMVRRGMNPDLLYDMAVWLILGGIIGARLYYVLFQWDFYFQHPADIFAVWKGGLAIHGGLLGGFFSFFVFTKMKKIPWLSYLDILMPGVILAQAIGRWGNFFNSEAFGRPTTLPWKLFIPEGFRPMGFETSAFYHPTFLYESLWDIAGFFLLVYLTRKFYGHKKPGSKPKNPGLIFCAYLAYYSFARFFIEGLRLDSLYLGTFRTAQLVSIVLFAIGVAGLFTFRSKTTKTVGRL